MSFVLLCVTLVLCSSCGQPRPTEVTLPSGVMMQESRLSVDEVVEIVHRYLDRGAANDSSKLKLSGCQYCSVSKEWMVSFEPVPWQFPGEQFSIFVQDDTGECLYQSGL